jgi:hypothetical protein
VSRAAIVEALRSRDVLKAARELFAAHPSGDVLVVIAPGVDVPDTIGASVLAGEHRASLLPLASALDVARSRSVEAARDLADPPPSGAVRVLYLAAHRSVAVTSAPGRVLGRVDPYASTRGAA